ncbi:MAG TPA: hypothetical protein VFX59_15490 [Polyangiales bacterium]|nr:hypothetical protein [Polyangiales bacterium]
MVEACERSGLRRKEFAKREGLHPGTFGFWASRLTPRQQSATRPATSEATPPFVAVRVRGAQMHVGDAHATPVTPKSIVCGKVEVVLGNGRRVRCQLSQVDDPRLAVLLALAEGGT